MDICYFNLHRVLLFFICLYMWVLVAAEAFGLSFPLVLTPFPVNLFDFPVLLSCRSPFPSVPTPEDPSWDL